MSTQIILLQTAFWTRLVKAGFAKKLNLKDGSVPTVCNSAAPPEEEVVSRLHFCTIICKLPFLFHRREGRGKQSSLAFKEKGTETARCRAVAVKEFPLM